MQFTIARISPLIEIEQPGTKQATREQVAITQGLDQFREQIRPAHDLVGVEENWFRAIRRFHVPPPCPSHRAFFGCVGSAVASLQICLDPHLLSP